MTAAAAAAAADPERRRARAAATAYDVPPAIQWHEGMLLAPQHFQLFAQRLESLLQYHAAAISPFHWGVRHYRVDPVLLVDGTFRVLELEAVMPDGLIVGHRPDEMPDLAVALAPWVEEMKQRPVPVHLAVAARGRGLALAERFACEEGAPAADENTGEGELPVPVLKPKLRLLLGEEPPPKYVSFPLAQVVYRNEVFARTRFEPPALRVAPGSPVYELCLAAGARLREKATFLADQVRSPSSSARVPQLLETKGLLHGLVGALPPFEALLRSGIAHPFPLYLAFCSLLGHAAVLGRSLVPPALDAYDHNDLCASFEQVRISLFKALDEGIHESYTAYPFAYADGAFRLRVDPDWMTRSVILGVRGPSGVADAEMAAWVGSCLIAARSRVSSLRDRRMSGAPRRRIEADADLVPARGVTLYSLSVDAELVVPGEELEIRNLDDPEDRRRPEEILLYVRNLT